ncbi:FAD/NAD(P)-binding domain-containing protein [Corynebacterium sp. TAE3-ERU2]|uniref:FAD/NAD(P)-binding protein n=1 Tax=Corynebacterium sp. TAE3-ERU2 TaxID=2849497 RepID=UPI001C461F0C|nr:FAD/NAD(P)-binding protein [Corynebacterium sp. TAE3-ERU2]MBV7301492.1 FAD/NAD(P)-binding protein [Corynebacterium sp. TAE3-ERU2]
MGISHSAHAHPRSIAIIGAGPRGISLLERLSTAQRHSDQPTPLTVHLIDPHQIGAGKVWRTDQPRTMCMNTLADAVTLYPDPDASVGIPPRTGPTMYEWIQTQLQDPDAQRSEFWEEMRATKPESNPSRALYGEYLRAVYQQLRTSLPEGMSVREHPQAATAITPQGAQDQITLADGTTLLADATVLALGWDTPAPSAEEEALAHASGQWIAPGNPIDQDLSPIAAGETVLVRGLGMSFFDSLLLLTEGRGGRFVSDTYRRSGLRYEPSGQEPQVVVASGRGYPYLPKSDYHSLPPAPHNPRTRAVIAELSERTGLGCIDFGTEVLPALLRDAHEAYYLSSRPSRIEEILQLIDSTEDPRLLPEQIAPLLDATSRPFDPFAYSQPLAGLRMDPPALTEHIATSLSGDIHEAERARESAFKNGMWALAASRKAVGILGEHGRYTHASRTSSLREFMALGQMAGSGPPLFRTRQLLALIDAGLVEFLGATPQVRPTETGFRMSSPTTGDAREARVLLDAFVRNPDMGTSASSVVRSVGDRARLFRFDDGSASRSWEVDPHTGRVIGSAGEPDPRLHAVGIPLGAFLADTTISPMPRTDPTMLQESDRVARSLLRIACGSRGA